MHFVDQVKFFFLCILAIPTVVWLVMYAVPNLYCHFRGPVDLKKKYKCKWALVTGAGSGIGKSLAETMALQGLNVVLVSLPMKDLDETYETLKNQFPNQEFRKIGVKFDHKTDYMPAIIKDTEDIDVQVVFNNAGYIVTAFFDHTNIDTQLANMECNATSCVKITHHFLQQMLRKNLKGCFVFTSSVSGYIPNPFAVMYGATKGFVSQFAASLAIEVQSKGIDVLAVHPSPVASNFFNDAADLDSLEMAKKTAVSPSSVPAHILKFVGRSYLGDFGSMALGMRVVTALVPYDFLTRVFALGAPFMKDYSKNNKNRGEVQQKK